MIRAVLDTNVLVVAVLSSSGAPARLLAAWRDGAFELVVTPTLLDELTRVLAHPKIAQRIGPVRAERYVALIAAGAEHVADVTEPPPGLRSRDPDDDHLLAIAVEARAHLVTGDDDLLTVGGGLPIVAPAAFEALLADVGGVG